MSILLMHCITKEGQSQNLHNAGTLKGQYILKQNCRAVPSPQKQKNALRIVSSVYFLCFLGEKRLDIFVLRLTEL